MNLQSTSRALCAAFVVAGATSAQAIDVLHIANANSSDYQAFIEARFDNTDEDPSNDGTWTHVGNGGGVGVVGGLLSRTTTFAGLHGGEKTVKEYLESFDLIIIGNGINSGSFTDNTGWSTITKPLLVHSALVSRASSNGVLTDRLGLFTGGQSNFVYGNPADTLVAGPPSPLREAIFIGVGEPTDLYFNVELPATAFTEANLSTTTFGGGVLVSSLINSTGSAHGVVYWEAGANNAIGQIQAAKRGFMPLRNANDSSSTLTADGKQVLSNLIDAMLVASEPVFLPPSNLVAKSGIESVRLSWTGSDGATSYNIKRSEIAGGPYDPVSTPGAVTGTTYTDTGLTNGTPYFYVVSAASDSPVLESLDSPEATATPVPFINDGIDILYVANGNSPAYENFAANGQFADNTWTQKSTGVGNDQIGGDVERFANFTGLNGGNDISQRTYLESFDLIIIGVPTTSSNFTDFQNGAGWASIAKPIIINSYVTARSIGGRMGMFSGDNALTVTFNAPSETVRSSSSALANAILSGVTSETDLYGFITGDLINGIATYGTGEVITRASVGNANHYGIVFWAAEDLTAAGSVLAANRAFLPLKGSVEDLNADGKTVLANLINLIQDPQVTPPNPYGEWAALNISVNDPLALPGFDQDGENDGIPNGLEWILGGDPLALDAATLVPVSTADATNGLTFVFTRATGPMATTDLFVDWSTDLAGFNSVLIGTTDVGPNGNNPTVDIDAPSPGQITVNIPAANAPDGKIFGRLKGVLNP